MKLSIWSIESAGPPEAREENHRARMDIPPRISEHSPFLAMAENWFASPAGLPPSKSASLL
jgi:hypothetical protein